MKVAASLLLRLVPALIPLLDAHALADSPHLSADRLNMLDQHGYFTPAFKSAVHDLVNAREAVVQAHADEAKAKASLPDLQAQSAAATAQVASLRQKLDLYAHPENADLQTLENAMKNPAAKPEDQLVLAQAFVWSYPTDPHQAEAVRDLQQIQKQLADQRQAEKATAAEKVAARARLLQRAKAKDLSLAEWQDFLLDRSQEELLSDFGRPQTQENDYWIYSGAWTSDPSTKEKVGLLITFNGNRVIRVSAAPNPP
jgi:hypothetical protein